MATVINSAFVAEILALGVKRFTFVNNCEVVPVGGYLVSIPNTELHVPLETFSADILSHYYTSNYLKGNLNSEFSYCVVSVHGANVYMESAVQKFDIEQAILNAMFRDQICIFDVENDRVIKLPKCQKCGTETQKKAYVIQVTDKIVSELNSEPCTTNT